jgi:hypothetical protein
VIALDDGAKSGSEIKVNQEQYLMRVPGQAMKLSARPIRTF